VATIDASQLFPDGYDEFEGSEEFEAEQRQLPRPKTARRRVLNVFIAQGIKALVIKLLVGTGCYMFSYPLSIWLRAF
jgi:hypothetical protein